MDEIINDTHREICAMKDWWWLHRLRFLTTIDQSSTFTAVAGTDVCTAGDTIRTDTGTRVKFSTTTTLPAGLSVDTYYFLVFQSSTTFQVASTLANALVGTVIDITDTGTGTHTVTVFENSIALPYDTDLVESVFVISGDQRYTTKIIHSREEWDLLHNTNITSSIPEYAFAYNGRLEFWPVSTVDGDLIGVNSKVRVIDLNVADYTTGTVTSITNGAITVTGDSTVWTSPMVGRYIRITHSNTAASSGDGHWYEIAARVSNTSILLTRPYGGTSLAAAAAASYAVGQMPLLPENFHDTPVYRAASIYWYNQGNAIKGKLFEGIYKEKLTALENYTNDTSDLVLDDGFDRDIINPNLTVRI